MKIRYTDTASFELAEIEAYIVAENPSAADAVIGRIKHVIDRISDFPDIALPHDAYGVRIFPVPSIPYLIFYTVWKGEVIIRNIRHAGRSRR